MTTSLKACASFLLVFSSAGTLLGQPAADQQHRSEITQLAFSPDSTVLATAASDATVRIWDCKTGKQLQVLRAKVPGRFFSGFFSVDISPDGEFVAACGFGDDVQHVFLWELKTGTLKATLNDNTNRRNAYPRHLSCSADGRSLLVYDDQRISVWDVE